MTVTFRPVGVMAEDGEGCLVFADGRLAAILVQLSGIHGSACGRWFLESGLGPLQGPTCPTFADLEEAGAWIASALGAPPRRRAG